MVSKSFPAPFASILTSEGGIFQRQEAIKLRLPISCGPAPRVRAALSLSHARFKAKFPLASVQLHYVRGCSLAEAFYQSISCPYQLLIVGDPLCQPWATIPKIAVGGVKQDEKVKGTLSLKPFALGSIGTYELYVDGRLHARTANATPFALDTTQLSDGYHELRVVGIRSDPIETQGRAVRSTSR